MAWYLAFNDGTYSLREADTPLCDYQVPEPPQEIKDIVAFQQRSAHVFNAWCILAEWDHSSTPDDPLTIQGRSWALEVYEEALITYKEEQ